MKKLEKILGEMRESSIMVATSKEHYTHPQDGRFVEEVVLLDCVEEIIRKYMNDGWIPVEERLPEVFGKYWATIRYDDGRISEPIVVDFRGVSAKYVVDTPNGREYETWGIDSAFHGSRVIAWRPYYIPGPYCPGKERRRVNEVKLKPCPFCGSEDIQEGSRTSDLCTDIYIRCRTCGGKMQICEEYGEEELVKRWNRRADNE
jgi:Lar family restriction alleviation protein